MKKTKPREEEIQEQNLAGKARACVRACVRVCVRSEVGGGGFIHIQASEERERQRRMHVHSGEEIWLWEHSEEQP